VSEATLPHPDERELLARARAGDGDAFDRLVAPHRVAVHVHCYRMVGSLHDAEDLLQESLLRAWRGLDGFEGRSSLRAWLYRIATNACLDALKRRKRRLLPDAYGPPDDPTAAPAPPVHDLPWLEPYPDRLLDDDGDPARRVELREGIELTFIAAIQLFSPRERAALLLRDVLGFSARETAAMLDASLASVNSALRRARAALAHRSDLGDADAGRPLLEDEATLVARYVRAWEAADVDALVALLREDVRMTMPPTPSWYAGRDAVGAFFATFLAGELGVGSRLLPTRANGQPALAVFAPDAGRNVYRPVGIKVLTLSDGMIAAITGFTEPGLFPVFGLSALSIPDLGRLPDELAGSLLPA
jgi:RNA polymerase sigma-70 factor (ECF subfamily)